MASDQAKIIGLEKQIEDLRRRLDQARENVWKAHDVIDQLERKQKRRDELLGPDYRYPAVCTDGRVFAHPAEPAREETIRWFAGQALGEAMRHAPDLDTAFRGAVCAGFRLWEDLETAFTVEREARKAAREATEAEGDDDAQE